MGAGYIDYAKNLRSLLDKAGITCNQAHAPFTFEYGMNIDTTEKKYLYIVHAIESAAILGAKNIVVHSVTTPKGVDFEQYNIEFYKSFIPYCEKAGICVAVENLFGRDTKRSRLTSKLGSPKELSDIVEKINSPWIVACVDIGHAALTGYEPEEFIEGLTPGILKCLHAQDNDYLDDRHIVPYMGNLNWEAIMTSLKNTGYTGDLTLEIIYFLGRLPDDLLQDGLNFSAKVAKHLVSIYDK